MGLTLKDSAESMSMNALESFNWPVPPMILNDRGMYITLLALAFLTLSLHIQAHRRCVASGSNAPNYQAARLWRCTVLDSASAVSLLLATLVDQNMNGYICTVRHQEKPHLLISRNKQVWKCYWVMRSSSQGVFDIPSLKRCKMPMGCWLWRPALMHQGAPRKAWGPWCLVSAKIPKSALKSAMLLPSNPHIWTGLTTWFPKKPIYSHF